MDNKIAISSLTASLAQASGKSKKLCDDFIKEFFKIAAETLEAGETLRVKGFGTFKIVEVESRMSVNVATGEPHEIAPYKKVVFTPSKELAAEINAPFEDFESVEIEDDFPVDFLEMEEMETQAKSVSAGDKIARTNIPEEKISNEPLKDEVIVDSTPKDEKLSDENNVSEYRLEEGSDEEGDDDVITGEAYNQIEKEKPEIQEPEKIAPIPNLPVYYQQPSTKSRFGVGFLIGALSTFAVCAIIFMLGCFFHWWPVNFGNSSNTPENVVNVVAPDTETLPGEEEQEEVTPVYDTVSTTRYLTTIARDHYGDFNFWPYIYMENENILGHPDRITPGTQVVVPELSKYGVSPQNKEDVAQAKKKAAEIYARFK